MTVTSGYSKKSRAYTGKFIVKNVAKYRGDASNVTYRSSWEVLFMKWCDMTPAVLEWGSEEIVVPYISPLDNKIHRYFVDFYIKIVDKAGQIKKYMIEVKPSKFTRPPIEPKRKTARYWGEVKDYAVNQAKWTSATEFAEEADCQFLVITEQDLGLDSRRRP